MGTIEKNRFPLWNPSKNIGYIGKEKDPQERSGSLKEMPIYDTAENTAQGNIKGVEYLV